MKKLLLSVMAVLFVSATVFATVPDRVGWWKFDNASDMLAATIGQPLALTGSQESVSGPGTGNLATLIGPGSYLSMTHGIAPNGGGTLVNEYSLQLDINIPEGALWHAIYQTTPECNDDAELFINTDNFLGAWRYGYSAEAIVPGTWYRVIVSVKNGEFFKIYVNGALWVDGTGQELDSRDALQAVVVLFGDDDGEDNAVKCAEAGIWNVALTAAEALELGDATGGGGGPVVPAKKGHWTFDNAQDMLAATIGEPLTLTGTQASVNGPATGNLATEIGVGSYLTMTHGIAPNLGGAYVNEFSVMIDFAVPEVGIWHAFIQTNTTNSNDADLFSNTNNAIGVGDVGYSENVIAGSSWYRMVLSVKNDNFFRIYINGELWLDGAGQPLDGRYGLDPVLNIFADDDGDDGLIQCAELAIWDVALTAEEAALLGSVSGNTGIADNKSSFTNDLGQNYPNPFSQSTSFPYEVVKSGKVSFSVTDLSGRLVKTADAGVKTPGSYTFNLDANDLPAGFYNVRMTVNERSSTRKIMIVR